MSTIIALPSSATAPLAQRTTRASASALGGCVRLLRVRQWLKNGFVFAPLVFAGKLMNGTSAEHAVGSFLSFSLVASAVYVLNDWSDRNNDRQHPDKCNRPIADGTVSGTIAAVMGLCLIVAGVAVAWFTTNASVAALEVIYLAINAYYSFSLKHVVILDVFAIAIGFVIRILVGAAAVGVSASHWLLLCTLLLTLFLGFSKRKSELKALGHSSNLYRTVLTSYSPTLITQLNVILCAATLVCYALYTVAPETVKNFGTDRLIYTVPFVIYGLFRYLFLMETTSEGANPSSLVLRDRSLGISVALWLSACLFIIYGRS
jgi:4-hydroxybenzoate polyprenyltransferase